MPKMLSEHIAEATDRLLTLQSAMTLYGDIEWAPDFETSIAVPFSAPGGYWETTGTGKGNRRWVVLPPLDR